jgi:hypothetical protein
LFVFIVSNNSRGAAGCQSDNRLAGVFVVDYRPFVGGVDGLSAVWRIEQLLKCCSNTKLDPVSGDGCTLLLCGVAKRSALAARRYSLVGRRDSR